MSDSDDQEERDNLAAREIALAEQHEDPPDPNAAHDRANDEMPRDGARHNEEVMGDFDSNPTLLINRNPIHRHFLKEEAMRFRRRSLALVKQNQFQGKPQENPLEHIDAFEEIWKALRWVKSLPAQSITTWKEYKVAFLGHFFTKQRANLLREKISSFQQGPVEPFHEALERFKTIQESVLIMDYLMAVYGTFSTEE
ncbi:unnamed protein product [Microthlaspi erraticum]|uniref:Retrotransposon gag domain-containing protein n=1 Tax=Microthlaspi erraticum TaxID=1685480 RepID=A0A6D2HWK3_9BRAS|nr:unnamed protein product [Microthlaspi erraticum]